MFSHRKHKKNLSEPELIELAKTDTYYFGELYTIYFERIYRFTFKRLGGNEEIAGDLAQQTFLKAMANIKKYEDRGLPFCSWLYRIAQNEVSMFFRAAKTTKTVDIDESKFKDLCDEANLNRYMSEEDQEQLVGLLNEMEQEQLDLIELRFFQELSFKEIADIYKISEPNAKMRVYRILEKLNKKWTERS